MYTMYSIVSKANNVSIVYNHLKQSSIMISKVKRYNVVSKVKRHSIVYKHSNVSIVKGR